MAISDCNISESLFIYLQPAASVGERKQSGLVNSEKGWKVRRDFS